MGRFIGLKSQHDPSYSNALSYQPNAITFWARCARQPDLLGKRDFLGKADTSSFAQEVVR